ncbi:MAG: magnesium transporter [Candidatus Omnitrophica bacterium]|nr:magnesium transporter [Candidatus Omnitrophota bacterium]
MTQSSLIYPQIRKILSGPDAREKLQALFNDLHPHDICVLIEDIPHDEIAQIITAFGIPKGIELFEEFEDDDRKAISKFFSREWLADILEEMSPDERADFVKVLSEDRLEEVLPLVAQAERNDIKRLLQYKEDTAGSILTTEYALLPPQITVREALERLRLQAPNRETIYYIYVVDEERRLLGFVSLKDIITSPSHSLISDIMHKHVISVSVDEDKEVVAKKLADYDFLAIPVVDNDTKLVGIVTVDDVVDVVIEETTEDMLRYGAAGEHIDYMESGPLSIARQRILWLSVLVFVGFISGWVIERFAAQLQAVVALAFFIPLLSGSSGNAGTQSSTVVIRGLATGEVSIRDLSAVFKKEIVTGIIVGSGMAVLAALRAVIMNKSPLLGVTVGLAMIVAVTIAATLGALLPILFKKMKLDPALMSGPFITSIVDVITIFVYFRIAAFIFSH